MGDYTTFEWLILAGAAYCLLDFVLGLVFMRCVLPGLRCRTCQMERKRGKR